MGTNTIHCNLLGHDCPDLRERCYSCADSAYSRYIVPRIRELIKDFCQQANAARIYIKHSASFMERSIWEEEYADRIRSIKHLVYLWKGVE